VGARNVGVLLGASGVGAVLALGGATVLAVVDSGTTGVDVRGGGSVVNVLLRGVSLTGGATNTALPAVVVIVGAGVVVTSVVKPVGVPGIGTTISVAVAVRVETMVACPGVAGILIVLPRPIRPSFMVMVMVMVAVPVVLFVLVAVLVVVVVPVVVPVVVLVVVFVVVAVVVFVPVVVVVFVPVPVPVPVVVSVVVVVVVLVAVVVRTVAFVPARITRPVMFPMPALTNAPERPTQVSGRSAGSGMRHGYIPQQLRGDVLAPNVEIHESIDGHPISHFGVPSS
jgi:hypothetical protein